MQQSSLAVCVAAASLLFGLWGWGGHEAQWPDRPIYDLPRTTQVLNESDCAFLAELYRNSSPRWTRTYFNMLTHRWNKNDERMGLIFDKVVAAANHLHGGSGDYVITNDFFSMRTHEMTLFGKNGNYHTDAGFWTVDASDGFNLWILIDHHGLNSTFDVLERSRNQELYVSLDAPRYPGLLIAWNSSDPDTSFKYIRKKPDPLRSSHHDVLSWASTLKAGFQIFMRDRVYPKLARHESFSIPKPINSNYQLALGEALVLRENEFHRTDAHRKIEPGQFRLAAGFKIQRRNAIVTRFLFGSPAAKDRFDMPLIWDKPDAPLIEPYVFAPGPKIITMGLTQKLLKLLAANLYSFAGIALLAAAAYYQGTSKRIIICSATGSAAALLSCVSMVQYQWLAGAEGGLAGAKLVSII